MEFERALGTYLNNQLIPNDNIMSFPRCIERAQLVPKLRPRNTCSQENVYR